MFDADNTPTQTSILVSTGGSGSPDLCDGEGGSDTATATCETTKDL